MRDLGKISRKKIDEIFHNKLGKPAGQIIQGSAFGVDISVVRISESKCLITASDPASFIPSLGIKESAWLTVMLTANDIATSGCFPEYAQFVLNLTHKITDANFNRYWNYIHQFCAEIGVSITGGHTGFDDIGRSTLAGGVTMFAIGDSTKIKCSSFAKPCQDLILTKSAALSSASILAKSFPEHTREHLGEDDYTILADSFYQTSILPEVKILNKEAGIFKKVSALHDVTEGGSLGAIFELCEASNIGVIVDTRKIYVGPAQKKVCELFQIDPLRSIGAGSLLIACEKEVSPLILENLRNNHISAAVVGETLPKSAEKKIIDSNGENKLVYLDKDPYWDAFFGALEKKLK